MKIKKILRTWGYDIVRYHPLLTILSRPMGIRTVLDIGANIGDFSKEMRERFPDAHIYAFEPLADCHTQMVNKMAGDAKFRAFNMALGEESGQTTIQRSSFNPSSSLLPMSDLHKKLYPKSAHSTEERIQIERLDDIAANLAIEEPLFIKMDVQGFEASVIRGGERTIKRAALLQIETSFVPLYEGQPLLGDIQALLQTFGFSHMGFEAVHYSQETGVPIYADALFVKDLPKV